MAEPSFPWATLRGRVFSALPVALFTGLFMWPVRYFLFDESWQQSTFFAVLMAVIGFPLMLLTTWVLRAAPERRDRPGAARKR
jgi:RsiW-degrading membrane proteinase PrsW (M82 family)